MSASLKISLSEIEVYINLKNVQEYIADPSELSFFSSKNGKLILNEIIKSAVNYIILSMRNLEISFECFETEELRNLTCHNWITFNGTDYKIIKIEKELSYNTNRLFITARGFGFKLSKNRDFTEPLNITKQETPTIHAEDIIEDIAIQNEADKQYEKLLNYISVLKKSNGITPANYKSLISKFLNENQTKIQIITKPLKTQHCENKTMDLGEIFIG